MVYININPDLIDYFLKIYSSIKVNGFCLSYLEMFIYFSKIKFNSEFLICSQKTLLRSFQTWWNCECVYSCFFNVNENNSKLFEIIGNIILMYYYF